MSIWAEAYTLPHVNDPGKKIAWLPALGGRLGVHTDAFREEGMISLPAAYERLDEVVYVDPDDHSNDVGSVIHIFQRGVVGDDGLPNPIGSFVANRRPGSLGDKSGAAVDISGPGLTAYFLDRVKLLPWDHPANPSEEPDWIYGGDNLLGNPSFEDNPLMIANPGFEDGLRWPWYPGMVEGISANAEVQTSVVDTGTYALQVTPLLREGGASTLLTNLEGGRAYQIVARFRGVSGVEYQMGVSGPEGMTPNGGGAFWDPENEEIQVRWNGTGAWQTITLNFITETNQRGGQLSIRESTVFNGGNFYIDVVTGTGFGVGASPWMVSRLIDGGRAGRIHGRYDAFEVSSEQAHSGTYSLKIDPGAISGGGTGAFAGVQQVVGVRRNTTINGSIWVYPTAPGQSYRLVIRGTDDSFIGWTNVSGLAANQWHQVTIQDLNVGNRDRIVFRFSNTNVSGNPAVFYVDDGYLAQGFPAALWGEIWDEIMADQNVDHAGEGRESLGWLVPTWTATEDSAGVPWDKARAVTLRAYDSLGQIAEAGQRLWGYVHRIRYDREDNTYYFDIFNPGYTVDDLLGTETGTLTVGMNILDGELVSRGPEGGNMIAVGSEGLWAEKRSTDLIDAWGWADSIVQAVDVMDQADLNEVAEGALARSIDQMVTYKADMTDQGPTVPFRDFGVFWKVGVNLGVSSGIPVGDRIVQSIVCTWKPGEKPDFEVFVGSDAFASSGMAGLAEAVRRLLRRPERPAGIVDVGGEVPLVFGEGGGAPTVVIAASDATEFSKRKADFICTGFGDEEIIQAALDIIVPLGGGRILFTEGRFYIKTDVISAYECTLEGMGKFATLFVVTGNGVAINLLSNSRIAHLGFVPGIQST